ncbi:MAG: EAL domain-containing protein [Sterolibacterium sp.]|nr:EAL domain-containing protein [Sterolibacterium sp.]
MLNRTLAGIRRAVPSIASLQVNEHGRVAGRYYGANISSVFQPWRAPASEEMVAVEACARSYSKKGEGLSPWQHFADTPVDSDLVNFDRLCRTVHVLNYFTAADNTHPLVLNVDARLLQAVPERHGEFFGKLLSLLGVSPENIFIEIRTIHQFDLSHLRQILASYRKSGFAVAVNAEGNLHARALAELLRPELLMLDAMGFSPDELRRQVSSLASSNVKIAVKRIETIEMANAVRSAGADWVQGYFFDQPCITVVDKLAAAA